MRDGLDSAAGQIQIGNNCGAQDAKGVEPFGGDIDVTRGIERRRRDKKEGLSIDKFSDGIVNRWMDFPHSQALLVPNATMVLKKEIFASYSPWCIVPAKFSKYAKVCHLPGEAGFWRGARGF